MRMFSSDGRLLNNFMIARAHGGYYFTYEITLAHNGQLIYQHHCSKSDLQRGAEKYTWTVVMLD
jgi:hypothetical protein